MKKIISIILCLVIIFTLSISLLACNKNEKEPKVEYKYDGRTSYTIGDSFEDGGTLTKYVDGKETTSKVINSSDISNFTTTHSLHKEWTTVLDNDNVSIPYFVSKEIVTLTNETSKLNDVYFYEDIAYGDQVYDGTDSAPRINNDSSQLFDAYIPKAVVDGTNKNPYVLLYVHGGAWMVGNKTVEGASFCQEMAENGFVVCTMNYILQDVNEIMFKNSPIENGSFTDMVWDIGIMISYLKGFLKENFDIDCTKMALSGLSAGGHLSTLFTYKYGYYSPIEIAYELDIVGPTQFSDAGYQAFLGPYLSYDLNKDPEDQEKGLEDVDVALAAIVQKLLPTFFSAFGGVDYEEFMKEYGILEDDEYVFNPSKENLEKLWAFADEFSSVFYINENSVPTILAYGKLLPETKIGMEVFEIVPALWPEGVETDLLVPCTCYEQMDKTLTKYGVHHVGKIFEGESHLDVNNTKTSRAWIVEQTKAFAELYLK